MLLFWCVIALMILAALASVVIPLLRVPEIAVARYKTLIHRFWLPILLVIILPFFAIGYYLYQGSWQQWASYKQDQQLAAQAQKLRAQMGTPQHIIDELKQHLQQNPQSAQGWYLLGRLYVNQQQFNEANTAFATAYALQPKNPDIILQYVQTLYLTQHTFTGKSVELLQQLLQLQPDNDMAINLLGVAAFEQGRYQQAIAYWEQILPHYAPDSPDGKALLSAIAKAQMALTKKGKK